MHPAHHGAQAAGLRRREVRVHRIKADGTVADVTIDPGPAPELIRGLAAQVASCRYTPATRGGDAIEVEMDEVFRVEPGKR